MGQRGLRWASQVVVRILLGANLATALFLCLSAWSSRLDPEQWPLISLLGLAFPVFLLLTLAFAAGWLLFKARYSLWSIAAILLVGTYVWDYCPLNLRTAKALPDSTPPHSLKILSFNVRGSQRATWLDSLTDYVASTEADIICLQEAPSKWLSTPHTQEWLAGQAYHSLQDGGRVILTRFPTLGREFRINYQSETNGSLACWLDIEGDSVLLINNHLESNRISNSEKDRYENALQRPTTQSLHGSLKGIGRKLLGSLRIRGPQTQALTELVDSVAPHPVILCGDFNDPPISYTYQHLKSHGLSSAYAQAGRGLGISFRDKGFPVRIDHVFYTPHWKSTHSSIDRSINLSDHYSFLTTLKKKV